MGSRQLRKAAQPGPHWRSHWLGLQQGLRQKRRARGTLLLVRFCVCLHACVSHMVQTAMDTTARAATIAVGGSRAASALPRSLLLDSSLVHSFPVHAFPCPRSYGCGLPRPLSIDCGHPRPLLIDCDLPRPLLIDCGLPRPLLIDCSLPRPLLTDCGHPRPLIIAQSGQGTRAGMSAKPVHPGCVGLPKILLSNAHQLTADGLPKSMLAFQVLEDFCHRPGTLPMPPQGVERTTAQLCRRLSPF